jgi:hypothetical protein
MQSLCHEKAVSPERAPTKMTYAFLASPMHETCPEKLTPFTVIALVTFKKSKVVPLHAIVALEGRGGIAPTHS